MPTFHLKILSDPRPTRSSATRSAEKAIMSQESRSHHQRNGSASPAHIVISTHRSPSPRPTQHSLSPHSQCMPKQSLLKQHHVVQAAPITATGIPSTSNRTPALMPAPTYASSHLFRPAVASLSSASSPISAQSPNSDYAMTTVLPQPAQQASQPVANGPISRTVIVPARAKPGRKAMDNSEKEDRRRKQNRNAQRNYRDRRSQQVAELSDEVKELQQQSREAHNQYLQQTQRLHAEQQQLRAELQKAMEETQQWIEKANYFERAFQQVINSLPRDERERHRELPAPTQAQHNPQIMRAQAALPDFSSIALPPLTSDEKMGEEAMPPTPPEDSPDETDFTQIWLQSRGIPSSQIQTDADNDDLTMSCGFCSNSDYCPCREAANQSLSLQAPPSPIAVTKTNTTTGPGTCDMCQADPARAEACRSLAGRTQPSASPPTSSRPADRTMSCGQFIDRANNNLGRMPSIAEILGPLHSYPAAKGFDVNEQEAAVVLQNMARRPSP